MKTKKISLQNMKGVLSRDEMKKISGGSGGFSCNGQTCGTIWGIPCCTGYQCSSATSGGYSFCYYPRA